MTEKDLGDNNSIILGRVCEAALKSLRKYPLQKVKDFDQGIKKRFPEEARILSTTLKGRDRTRFENLIDWAKANLTKRGFLHYTTIKGDRYMVFLEDIGNYKGNKFVDYNDADNLMKLLFKHIPE